MPIQALEYAPRTPPPKDTVMYPALGCGKLSQVAAQTRPRMIQKRGVRVRSRRSAPRMERKRRNVSCCSRRRTASMSVRRRAEQGHVRILEVGKRGHGVVGGLVADHA